MKIYGAHIKFWNLFSFTVGKFTSGPEYERSKNSEQGDEKNSVANKLIDLTREDGIWRRKDQHFSTRSSQLDSNPPLADSRSTLVYNSLGKKIVVKNEKGMHLDLKA